MLLKTEKVGKKDAASLQIIDYQVYPEEVDVKEVLAGEQCEEVGRNKSLADAGHHGKAKQAGVSGSFLRMLT